MSLPLVTTAALGFVVLGATVQPRPRAAPPHRAKKLHAAPGARPGPKARRPTLHPAGRSQAIPLKHSPGARAEAYGALEAEECLAELRDRQIPFVREAPKRGVKIPVRLTGKVAGVLYRTDFPDAERANVPWEVFDCRLVLSLDDFGESLRAHSISEVRIFSAWRPPAKTWPMDEWGRRHEGALAIDVRELRKDTGEVLNVLDHFHGRLGATQCSASGPGLQSLASPADRELHEIVCAAADAHIFNSILTPNYNLAHKNHFHLELTPDVDWFMLR